VRISAGRSAFGIDLVKVDRIYLAVANGRQIILAKKPSSVHGTACLEELNLQDFLDTDVEVPIGFVAL
jgi:hypothetical protein